MQTTPDAMRAFFARFAAAANKPTVVMESGTHSRWVSELIQELGLEVVVANPAHVRLIYGNKNFAEPVQPCRSARQSCAVALVIGRVWARPA